MKDNNLLIMYLTELERLVMYPKRKGKDCLAPKINKYFRYYLFQILLFT